MTMAAATSDSFFPPGNAAMDGETRKLLGQSNADAGSGESNVQIRQPRPWRWIVWLAVIGLITAAVSFSSLAIASRRTVYVVNGSTVSLRVTIDGGSELEIDPVSTRELTLPEGSHHWEISHPEAAVAEGDFEVRTGFLERFSTSPMFVLDPARTVVTVWEKALYGADTKVRQQLLVGETFHSFNHVDLKFKPFPHSVKSSNTRTRVEPILLEPAQVIGFVSNDLAPDEQLDFCERHLQLTPRDEKLISAYGRFAVQASEYQRLYRFLRDGIHRRPLEISWHRRYQSAALRVDRAEEMFVEYDALLKQLPGNSAALYLRGRIESHGPLAEELFDRSIDADPSNPFPYYARCHRQLSLARYTEAFESASKASTLEPDNQDMTSILHKVRLALGQYEDLEREQRQLIAEESIQPSAHFRLLGILATQNRLAEMRQAHDEFTLAVNNEIPLDPYDYVLTSERFVAYCNRDYQRMMDLTLQLKNPLQRSNMMLEVLVSLHRDEELIHSDLMERPPAQRGFIRIYVSLIHELRGNTTESLSWLKQALDDFRDGSPETMRIAQAVGDFEGVNLIEDLDAIAMTSIERLLVSLAVASQTQGETRQQLLDLSRRLNFSPGFPNHFVAQLIESLGETVTDEN
jgi:hypothetical protein